MAEERGLRRRYVVPVPVLTPRLSSLWIHLVTPISHRIARPLAEGLRNRVVCRNDDAQRLMPQTLLTVREAIRAALDRVAHDEVETSWSMAGPIPGDPDWAGGTVFTDRRAHPGRGAAGCGLARGRAHRRRPRLVCRGLAVAPARVDGPAGGWARPEARSARSRPGRLRRGARLLAGDRDREGPSAVPAGGDEAAGRGAPRVHRRAGGGRHAAHPDGPLPAAGPRSASPTGTRSSPSTPSSSGACSRAFAPQRSAFGTSPAPTPEARPAAGWLDPFGWDGSNSRIPLPA